MLTKNEITALNLSPTKKDFVQIWNELLEVAGRLSERWDPTSTNESDPGIVILKALTGIADKLNYNIDKNTLEAFMPTAAQEESMRKLCDMLGYNVKYYRSAETTVKIKYYNSDASADEKEALQIGLVIPKFTVITNGDQDINYFTINEAPLYISETSPNTESIPCLEGQIIKCESSTDNNVITANQISDNNRFYLPEHQIAENGIFVYNVVANQEDGDLWKKVDNLNIQARGSKVFKFGYDSYEGRPYLEFPEDYSELINDGLFIYYTRTSGANGNVSARTLTQLELPNGENWDKVSAESFSVENTFSATSGSNIETISQAYNNFKKTVGTFETLVTCRDYMNKIYTMTDSDTGKYLVSNALVTDIRTDLNRAITICSCDDAGIFYKETPIVISTSNTTTLSEEYSPQIDGNPEITETFVASTANKPIYLGDVPAHYQYGDTFGSSGFFTRFAYWRLGDKNKGLPIFNDKYSRDFIKDAGFIDSAGGDASEYTSSGERSKVWIINQNNKSYETTLPIDWVKSTETVQTNIIETKTITNQLIKTDTPAIDHFDLVLYPFKSYNQIKNSVKDIQAVYDKSFEYDPNSSIKTNLEQSDIKTIAHNIISPRSQDIISINNYLRLNAIIGTTSKVTVEEGKLLIEKIKIALANAFNMRELDFGDEIPFDSILSVIENADARISVVSLAEPALYTTFSVYEGADADNNPILKEYAVASDWLTESYADASDRFEYTYRIKDGDEVITKYAYTFDTVEAKKIYNKLAVRNILAGRVPLFKYNTTFKTGFSDSAYRVTKPLEGEEFNSLPDEAKEVLSANDNPFAVYTVNDVVYTGQHAEGGRLYTKAYVPEEYADGVITKTDDNDTNYTEIETKCEVFPDKGIDESVTNYISNVELAEGEYIKFRAPNFITKKTYPAYVNYHLKLDRPDESDDTSAKAAEAKTLSSLLMDKTSAGETLRTKLFREFDEKKKKKFTLIQTIYGTETSKNISSSTKIEDPNTTDTQTPELILNKSGFVRLITNSSTGAGVANVAFSDNEIKTLEIPNLYLKSDFTKVSLRDTYGGNTTPYILTVGGFNAIKEEVNDYLISLPVENLPTKDWSISYEFEYIPFELETLKDWDNFAAANFNPIIKDSSTSTHLWRIYQGSYPIGEYILSDGVSMLMPFNVGHFGLLAENRLDSIYIVEDIGRDAVLDYISNDEEYQLRTNEYLYIEYTPSTTTEDGTAQNQEPIIEVFGKGSIIKPSGFESGLVASEDLVKGGKSYHKKVDFSSKTGKSEDSALGVHSLGASEQIAIRELSKVELNSETLVNSPTIYVYKNFNDCDILEVKGTGKRSYTLKDGEYIFYTDKNQAEFAYFTSGTEVTLNGREDFVLPKREIIDIATIFDNGIQSIPWGAPIIFGKNDSITFQEYQYITLGPNDTLQSLKLDNHFLQAAIAANQVGEKLALSSDWQKCLEATYTVAGSSDLNRLSNVNLSSGDSSGNGWEVCSTLALNVSPNSAQTLRATDKVKTSIILHKPREGGNDDKVIIAAEDAEHPITFRANTACVSSTGNLKISDTYDNPAVKSFELKILSEQPPAIVKTKPDQLVPYSSSITDITTWINYAEKTFVNKSYGDLWTRVPLAYLSKPEDDSTYDNALKLSVSVLPNTYGIFSIYLNYSAANNVTVADVTNDTHTAETWIDLMPGSSQNDITLLNVPANEIVWDTEHKDKYIRLKLRPGINCIRVNKTCDLFVKTSLSSEDETYEKLSVSTLYFDDLRLVNCQPVEYIENGEKKLQKTQGLNLTQIGYLDTEEVNSLNAFDLQIRKSLRKELTDSALEALDERTKVETAKLDSVKTDLLADKADLSNLVDFISTAKTEIDTLISNTADGNIEELFEKYNELREDLTQEERLRDTLQSSKNIIELETQLADLLASLDSGESAKQELLGELDTLDFVASSKVDIFSKEGLSKGSILDDFDSAASSGDSLLLNDLKLFNLKEVNAEYATRLSEVVSDIEAISDNTAKETLLTILEDINIAKHSELVTQIESVIGTKQETLNSLLDNAEAQANGQPDSESDLRKVDYVELRAALISLREYLVGADIAEILSEISIISDSAMENSDKYSNLIRIIDELNKLLDDNEETTTSNYASLKAKIDSLITTVQTKITSNDTGFDSSIVSSVEELSTEANNSYISRLKELLSSLRETLLELEDTYSAAIESLNDTEVIQAILSKLDAYKLVRHTQIETIENFEAEPITDTYTSLPYGLISVLSVWPAYMKRSYIVGIANLYRDIRKAINAPGSISTLDTSFYAGGELRQALADTANLAAYQKLFNQAAILDTTTTQSSKRADLINALGSLIVPSSELASALEAVRNDTDNYAGRNVVLQQLITAWQAATNITEEQRLLTELRAELESVIKIDTQLVEISAKLLCPSILLFPSYNTLDYDISGIDEAFYDRLRSYVDTQKANLTNTESNVVNKLSSVLAYLENAYAVTHSLLTALNDDNFSQFDLSSIIASEMSETLLTKAYLERLLELKPIQAAQAQIKNIKSSKLLSLLQKDLVTAWEDDSGNWRDSQGDYYQKLIDGQWAAYPINGTVSAQAEWLAAAGAWTTSESGSAWKTQAGSIVNIDAKRHYNGDYAGQWTTAADELILIKDNIGWLTVLGDHFEIVDSDDAKLNLRVIFEDNLFSKVENLGQLNYMSEEDKAAHNILWLETQLLNEIRALDKNREFYYNVPVEANVSIDFNEGETKLNTLMNPAVNYDINNVNNNFVISKIDINYLTDGLQIARSSKFN